MKFSSLCTADDPMAIHYSKIITHYKRCGAKKYYLLLLLLGLLLFVLWLNTSGSMRCYKPLPSFMQQYINGQKHRKPKDCLVSNTKDPGFSAEEWDRMQKIVHWGGPDRNITTVDMSTSPKHSTFTINDYKDSYSVGEELNINIVAKDFNGVQKHHGWDFFQAKVYSDELKASVFGEVLDHHDGTYSARFTLPWAGQAFVGVRLMHSSEAVQVLKWQSTNETDRVYFNGIFVGKDAQGAQVEEKVVCSAKWDGVVLSRTVQGNCCCEYQDVRTRLTWQCHKPPTLPCNSLVYHSLGGYTNRLTEIQNLLLDRQHMNQWLQGDSRVINVRASNTTMGAREPCKPGLPTPVPAGFYMNDVWTSFVCATRQFTSEEATQCLSNKHIYIMGDSTCRQWFDYFIQFVPTLKRLDLHTSSWMGPLMGVDVENNIDLHFRAHGLPLRTPKIPVVSVHYLSNQIDDLAGGPHTVIVFDMWAHFTTFPISYYAYRVSLVRRAVVALLKRAPETKVIIKTANIGFMDIYGSDWYAMQLDRILREAFRGVGVYILDVWQMTACHYNTDDMHPTYIIIRNEMDILLSFLCPT